MCVGLDQCYVVLCEINWIYCKLNWVEYGGYGRSVGVIYVLYLLCYVKGIYELREGQRGVIYIWT